MGCITAADVGLVDAPLCFEEGPSAGHSPAACSRGTVPHSVVPILLGIGEFMTLVWIVIAILAIGGEILATNFLAIFVAFAALIAAVLTTLQVGLPAQLVAFCTAALLLPVLLRRQMVGKLSGRGVPSRTETLVGTMAEVTQSIDPVLGTGRVIVGGQDWAARSANILPTGAKVTVTGADGIVLLVSPLPMPESDSPPA
jgi:membrane protein implicated in regulation of membrane protease activity